MGSNSWFKFYPSDWRGDPKLRICSLAARGLWIEMLAIMHEANPRGHLLVNDTAPNDAQLAILTGAPANIGELISELERANVFSRKKSGVIYSRRMVVDENKKRIAQKFGAMGGNPTLCSAKEKYGGVKGRDKPQRPEAIDQIEVSKTKPCPKRKRVSYPDEFEDFWKAYPTDSNMSKKEAASEWSKLDPEDQKLALRSLEAFSYYCKKNSDYRPIHACRYLKHRRFDGHAKAVDEVREKARPSFKFRRGTPQYLAWNDYRAARGQPQIHKDEWFFPAEWPPEHPLNLKAKTP